MATQNMKKLSINLLSKDWVELFRYIVLLIVDRFGAKPDDEVGVSLAVDVSRVKVVCLWRSKGHKSKK